MTDRTSPVTETDIVQRLRNFCVWNNRHSHYDPVPVCQEAAAEIERLRGHAQTPAEPQPDELARERLAIARLRAAVTGEEFEWEIDGGSPFDDVQFLLAAYDRLAAVSDTSTSREGQ